MSPRREELTIDGLKPIPDEVLVANYSPEMPSGYEDPAEERRYRKERLVGALRLFAEYGFDEGVAGHISARDPEFPHLFWVNPFLIPFAHVKVSDLSLVDEDGNVLKGKYPIARAAFVIHACIHKHRPDVVGAAHAHSIYGKALSATDQFIEPLTQDAAVFYNDQASFDDYTGVVVDLDEGNRLATTLGDKKAIILRNHGHLTVGKSVDSAAYWYITMERSAQAQLAAKAAGEVHEISPEYAKFTYDQTGMDEAGWFQFQPLYERIVRAQPDLLD
ncbi:class II aldolase/adducin family protein [Paractinoplanes abujensis]|uniref:Ribulose-5-phosphate 4-epimerase/fuculose-1-phosphate aldolase n=1 Tax=Paractinoplanes abujensis TaxID=882441 RepID=A0A7W7CNB5_9ACTN|nr:class II aldolase/adducin family protein [Actinoplanes abujensis]MBB4689946.1 ribulose-5-phosphate 4-epimerase/fuculose-1-phosphate aldolase [Actinoplanes abujensis]GID24647.1 class II aldolase/adducin family protein [Actinoplanes abujensis]